MSSSVGNGLPSNEATFLDVDDRLSAAEMEGQALVIAQQLGVFGRQRLEGRALGAALDRLERFISAGITLATPIGESR